MRQANPNLTWRDLKLIIAASARKNDPTNPGWKDGGKQIRRILGVGPLSLQPRVWFWSCRRQSRRGYGEGMDRESPTIAELDYGVW